MRTLLLSIATAASALAIAAPASAQYYPPQNYGYNQGYGQGYHHPGFARALDARIDGLQRQIRRMDSRNVISEREAERLKQESRQLEARLARMARNGFSPGEANAIERGIARLEQRMARYSSNGRYGNGWGNNQWGDNRWSDRDRDGRDDRYEDDRGRDHD